MSCIYDRLEVHKFGDLDLFALMTGSAVFGADKPNDEDWLVVGSFNDLEELRSRGWRHGGSLNEADLDGDWFVSLRKGRFNIIFTRSEVFAQRWIDAHDECVAAKPAERSERVRIFRRHLYGEAT